MDEQLRLEIGEANEGRNEAMRLLRRAQAELQDAPPGPIREERRASVDYYLERVKEWNRAEYTAILHHQRRVYLG